MTDVVFYFQVHQPYRLRRFSFFDIGKGGPYFDDELNQMILERVAQKCYLPMNALLLKQIEKHEGRFRISFSISGTALTQMERWGPEVLDSFRALVDTGCVELLAETSHHSLAFLADMDEFREQIKEQLARLDRLFGVKPRVFRNTELVIDERVALAAEAMGFEGLMGEGAEHALGWRSAHHVYRPEGCERLKLLLRAYRLSDDIAFRFSDPNWPERPLTAPKFTSWAKDVPEDADYIGLFMDYETFGEHQWQETGIFQFMEHLPGAMLEEPRFAFRTPTEVVERHSPISRLSLPRPVSWADEERDLTAWLGNEMQQAAHRAVHDLGPAARRAREEGDPETFEAWRRLTTSDHFYYMCVKYSSDGDVHKYFSPYGSPHDAYITFMNVIDDLARRLRPFRTSDTQPARVLD